MPNTSLLLPPFVPPCASMELERIASGGASGIAQGAPATAHGQSLLPVLDMLRGYVARSAQHPARLLERGRAQPMTPCCAKNVPFNTMVCRNMVKKANGRCGRWLLRYCPIACGHCRVCKHES